MKHKEKNEMKGNIAKRIGAVLFLSTLLVTSAAAAGGTTAFNQAGLIRWNKTVVTEGQGFTAPNGQTVPSVITYTDAAGGKTNYLSVRQIAELIDTPIAWDASKNSVVLGGNPYPSNLAAECLTPSGIGSKIGPFTEIDPSSLANVRSQDPINYRIISEHGTGSQVQTLDLIPGGACSISITNNTDDIQFWVLYRTAPGSTYSETYSPVTIAPGQTLTRAFKLDENANRLSTRMNWSVQGDDTGDYGPSGSDDSICITYYSKVA